MEEASLCGVSFFMSADRQLHSPRPSCIVVCEEKGGTFLMKLIVGLGNPGVQYANTRHNIGFMAVDRLAEAFSIDVTKNKFKSLYGEGTVRGEKIVLLKPMTYMNASGEAVREAVAWYKPDPEDLIVIYDDMDTMIGKLRLRQKGSAGGHNGIKSIIQHYGTQEFNRVRMGIGRPHPGTDVIRHVLTHFRQEEWPLVEEAVSKMPDVIECTVNQGFKIAMNRFNG
jgi:PTH1 family peptidyl-tRNA hydrolase